MAPRWKWKGAEAKALAEPVSTTISELRSSLIRSEASGFLSSCSILLVVEPEQAELLDNGCFGRPIVSAEKDKRWFQLSLEEAFFLFHNLKCIKISIQDRFLDNETEVWRIMKSKKANFPVYYKAYSHLRSKNWILRSGLQYGVDFVAYRHHPSLVHSEYAVLVQPGDGYGGNFRLRVWSDIHCAVRLCGSVAKTLLVLYVNGDCKGEDLSSCLENYTVEEQTITRWSPEQSRENETSDQSRVNARTIKPLTSS
ncbi:PREDICTED: tRNA-splicing endonuclease subunit Sen2-1-like isoform X2 [Tarenaya hassleriana]|nr:PREDICTED: tRNA-splicing endonuclease subunit Sen2-1-like isoform X2 [Tarenaya hassleriana]XP_010534466.1 PREDICTED: tRNA-splicing endonuclease subunit Sen2-1-like isoform X2 [Tarenaya hassleriana]